VGAARGRVRAPSSPRGRSSWIRPRCVRHSGRRRYPPRSRPHRSPWPHPATTPPPRRCCGRSAIAARRTSPR
jgi:hypothetical protein